MEHSRWLEAWENGNIGFHISEYHPLLVKYYESLKLEENSKILIPLSGKTLDILFFAKRAHNVVAVELSELAVQSFFEENHIPYEVKQNKHAKKYVSKDPKLNIEIYCDDLFNLEEADFDLIYDRASIVALPPEIRIEYRSFLQDKIKNAGQWFIISFEYVQEKMDGPPFSVPFNEIKSNTTKLEWKELESQTRKPSERFQANGLDIFSQSAYLGKKI
tara:strand:+ start:695 stop:1348 length:654 start_codon:yes stop_codon:yes gene_type:complete